MFENKQYLTKVLLWHAETYCDKCINGYR